MKIFRTTNPFLRLTFYNMFFTASCDISSKRMKMEIGDSVLSPSFKFKATIKGN